MSFWIRTSDIYGRPVTLNPSEVAAYWEMPGKGTFVLMRSGQQLYIAESYDDWAARREMQG